MNIKHTFFLVSFFASALVSQSAHAGFFDFLFGDDEAETTSTESSQTQNSADVVESLKDSAIQKASEALSNQTQTQAPPTDTVETAKNVAAGLLPMLTSKLGVNESQAQGGMGSLLQMAQSNLSADEFSQLGKGIPNMDALLAAAPLITGGDSSASKLLAKAGNLGSAVSGVSNLYSQFDALGLSGDMIMQYVNVAMSYFKGNGGNTADLLQKGLGVLTNQS